MTARSILAAAAAASVFCAVIAPMRAANAGTWQIIPLPMSGAAGDPSFHPGTMLLLTDGSVMVHDEGSGSTGKAWYRISPDGTGSYVNGAWTRIGPMLEGRLFYASSNLTDGRVMVAGGAHSTGGDNSKTAEVYDPVTNKWTATSQIPWDSIGDAPCKLLGDGRLLIGSVGTSATACYDPIGDAWTPGPAKLNGGSGGETWALLPDNSILTVSCVPPYNAAQRYVPAHKDIPAAWVNAGTPPVDLVGAGAAGSSGPYETGPGITLPDGRCLFVGATGNTAFYDTATGTWAAGPGIPTGGSMKGAVAAVETNGKVLLAAGPPDPSQGGSPLPRFYEFDPSVATYTLITSPANDAGFTYSGRMLQLPSGQILYSNDQSQAGLAVYTPAGAPLAAWKPKIISLIRNTKDASYHIIGTQLCGISEGAYNGTNAAASTNFPIVRITSVSTGQVHYARAVNWSVPSILRGATSSVDFILPPGMVSGSYLVQVVANGIASDSVSLSPLSAFTLSAVSVAGGGTISGRVVLSRPAPVSGVSAAITSDNAAVTVSSPISIPYGQTQVQFPISLKGVDARANANVTASIGLDFRTAAIAVLPASVSAIAVDSTSSYGGLPMPLTVYLNGAAGPSGVSVAVSSSDGKTVPPGTVVKVPAGATFATVTVKPPTVSANVLVTLAAAQGGVTKTTSLTVKAPDVLGVAAAPASVTQGQTVGLAATLSSPAPAGGAVVALSSSSTALTFASGTLTVPAGLTAASAKLTAASVAADTTVTLNAKLNGSAVSCAVSVLAPTIVSLALSGASATSPATVTGTVKISGPAPAGGLKVTLSGSNAAVTVPASVLVPAGTISTTFPVATNAVNADTPVTISAVTGAVTKSAVFTSRAAVVSSIAAAPAAVNGGQAVTLKIGLTGKAGPAGVAVLLSSSDGKVIPAGARVTVAAGTSSVATTITPVPVSADIAVTVKAATGGIAVTTPLAVKAPTLISIVVSPAAVSSGKPVTVKVTIGSAAPAGGLPVKVSSDSALISVAPGSVTIPAGSTSGSMIVTAGSTTTSRPVNITATLNGVVKTAAVTVAP